MNIIPFYDIEEINLYDYNDETRKTILNNLEKYIKLKKFGCATCNLTELPKLPNLLTFLNCNYNNLLELPNLPNSLIYLYCNNNNLIELPDLPNSLTHLYCNNNNLIELPDLPNSLTYLYCNNNNLIYKNINIKDIKAINKTNLKNKILKRMQLLNRTLLLEHSAVITMNPKRIERLLDNLEIDFYDGSFDTLTS